MEEGSQAPVAGRLLTLATAPRIRILSPGSSFAVLNTDTLTFSWVGQYLWSTLCPAEELVSSNKSWSVKLPVSGTGSALKGKGGKSVGQMP